MVMRSRALAISVVLCGLLWFSPAAFASAEKGESRPNLIIVLVDTLRADHLGYHGYEVPTSPRIDALAKRSAVFMNHKSHSSRTGPSVASVFTGMHPRTHGVVNPLTHFDAKGTLSSSQVTLAEILEGHGYRNFGFVGNPNVSPRFGFSQGFERYEFLTSGTASAITRRADETMKAMKSERAPFMIYLHYMEPHSSYEAPAPYHEFFASPKYDGPVTGAHRQLDRIVAGKMRLSPPDLKQLVALYDQEIRYFDAHFENLLAAVERHGFDRRTIIVFISDHGEEFLDHGSVLHGYTLYEEQLHVPFFIYDPRRKDSVRIDAETRHVDFLPTILDLLDIETKRPVQGVSLVPWINGKTKASASGPVFAQVTLRAVKTVDVVSFSTDGWKLIVNKVPKPSYELFRLADDPGERKNLHKAQPAAGRRIGKQWLSFLESIPLAEIESVELSEEEIERLRSLGYMQ